MEHSQFIVGCKKDIFVKITIICGAKKPLLTFDKNHIFLSHHNITFIKPYAKDDSLIELMI